MNPEENTPVEVTEPIIEAPVEPHEGVQDVTPEVTPEVTN